MGQDHHRNRTGLLAGSLVLAGALLTGAAEPSSSPQYTDGETKVPAARADEPLAKELSIEKALAHLESGNAGWSSDKKCVSCHTNGTYLFVRSELAPLYGTPSKQARKFFVEELQELEQTAEKRSLSGTRPAQAIYIAAGLAQWDRFVGGGEYSSETDRSLRLVLNSQLDGGTWSSLTCWPPFESSAYQEATMAAIAIAAAPGWLESIAGDPLMEKVNALKTYLRETPPPHDYGRAVLLWASLRMDGILDQSAQRSITAMLRSRQRSDGGWSIRTFAEPDQWGGGNRASKLRSEDNFGNPDSDGHMTGLAVVLQQEYQAKYPKESSASNESIERGLQWLRTNQRESGRWWTRSLNTDSWHYITYSGTAYALLALANEKTSQ